MPREASILETLDLSGGYGRTVIVDGVNVSVARGEIVALVGPNGSGKSTLLKTIYGVASVLAGKVVFKGRDVTRLPPEKKTAIGMNFVLQTDNIFPDLTVRENLEMGGYLLRDESVLRDSMEIVFNIFPQLRGLQGVLAGSLSGGQQRMLAIGRALMTRPELLLLDEPTAGLAPKTALELLGVLTRIREEADASILIVEQHARRALELADRGYVLVSGRIAAEGHGKDILAREDLQKLFLGVTG
ncbi:MAG: ABC transporter ATP-binding protein [Desulfurococcales archaeon]|nr:ABC transporter ATP-binding protein [Desulfurococcales archaeon]